MTTYQIPVTFCEDDIASSACLTEEVQAESREQAVEIARERYRKQDRARRLPILVGWGAANPEPLSAEMQNICRAFRSPKRRGKSSGQRAKASLA